ncbi:MAG: Sir2 family NAD-dependent protein deacetylase [Planctomycetota bacterium]
MSGLPAPLADLIARGRSGSGPIVVLTGAGISAESGIPTFRGPEGYWTVGSTHYRAEELATFAAFSQMPEEVWAWYLYRRSGCRQAEPNAAHRALVTLEAALGDRFLLVTQNVDGLHPRAGNSAERTYAIHGNLDLRRCANECGAPIAPFDAPALDDWAKGRALTGAEAALLRCDRCGGWLRPHVLWFDECYDEARYRFDSSLRAAHTADLLLVIGTSGATNLPNQMCETVHARGAPFVVLNRDPSPFSRLAEASEHGVFAPGDAASALPPIVAALTAPG